MGNPFYILVINSYSIVDVSYLGIWLTQIILQSINFDKSNIVYI